MRQSVGKSPAARQGVPQPKLTGTGSTDKIDAVRLALIAALSLLPACDKLGSAEAEASGELSRAECVQMTIRVNELRNKELGRVNSKEQKNTVDRCMSHGSRAQLECVQFANNASELARCDELGK